MSRTKASATSEITKADRSHELERSGELRCPPSFSAWLRSVCEIRQAGIRAQSSPVTRAISDPKSQTAGSGWIVTNRGRCGPSQAESRLRLQNTANKAAIPPMAESNRLSTSNCRARWPRRPLKRPGRRIPAGGP